MANIYVTWDLADDSVVTKAIGPLRSAVRPHHLVPVPRTSTAETGTGMLEEHLALIRESRLVIAFLGAEWETDRSELPPAQNVTEAPTHRDVAMVLASSIPVLPVLLGDTPIPRKQSPKLAELRTLADQAKDALDKLVPDPGYRSRLGFLHLVQTDMRHVLDLVATPDRPLVVFVDDLDRCSPGTVAQVIEAINLFLAGEFPNCVFVLAVEPAVVAAHIEVTYKDLAENLRDRDSTLGWRFMAKIVQLPLSLPPPGETADGSPDSDDYLDSLLGPAPDEPEPIDTGPTTPIRPSARAAEPEPDEPPSLAERDSWNQRVAAVEAAIRRRSPTVGTLPEACRLAQQEVFGAFVGLRAETVEAANRVFADLYSDADARAPIATALTAAGIRNPREIKRFINLYRFYTFIGQQATLHGDAPIDPDVVAKIVTLALRWPHLLNTLRASLGELEKRARAVDEADWATSLIECALAESDDHRGDLRRFLADGPAIASAARVLI